MTNEMQGMRRLAVFVRINKGASLEIGSGVSEMFISPKVRRRFCKTPTMLKGKDRLPKRTLCASHAWQQVELGPARDNMVKHGAIELITYR